MLCMYVVSSSMLVGVYFQCKQASSYFQQETLYNFPLVLEAVIERHYITIVES